MFFCAAFIVIYGIKTGGFFLWTLLISLAVVGDISLWRFFTSKKISINPVFNLGMLLISASLTAAGIFAAPNSSFITVLFWITLLSILLFKIGVAYFVNPRILKQKSGE